jgi:hypothetical protein
MPINSARRVEGHTQRVKVQASSFFLLRSAGWVKSPPAFSWVGWCISTELQKMRPRRSRDRRASVPPCQGFVILGDRHLPARSSNRLLPVAGGREPDSHSLTNVTFRTWSRHLPGQEDLTKVFVPFAAGGDYSLGLSLSGMKNDGPKIEPFSLRLGASSPNGYALALGRRPPRLVIDTSSIKMRLVPPNFEPLCN